MDKVIINGKFLNQPISGVQRYGHGIIGALELNAEVMSSPSGRLASNYWEQTTLPATLKRQGSPLLLNFCNTAPARYENQIVTIHDLAVFENPSWFQTTFAEYYKLLFKRLSKKAKHFVTVSEFSKREMIKYLGIADDKITVIPSAVQDRFNTLGIKPRGIGDQQFVLMVGNYDPRKNFQWVIEHAASKLHELGYQIIVAGRSSSSFRQIQMPSNPNVYWLEKCSDAELKWLYKNATLVIHPSIYEGFSLVPLEAYSLGSKVLVSDITVHNEILGDRIEKFQLDDPSSLLHGIVHAISEPTVHIPYEYSFKRSAAMWAELVRELDH